MAKQTRLANKTQWALQDITGASKEIRGYYKTAMKRAEDGVDPAMMLLLAKILERVTKIERKAILALQGEYEEE